MKWMLNLLRRSVLYGAVAIGLMSVHGAALPRAHGQTKRAGGDERAADRTDLPGFKTAVRIRNTRGPQSGPTLNGPRLACEGSFVDRTSSSL